MKLNLKAKNGENTISVIVIKIPRIVHFRVSRTRCLYLLTIHLKAIFLSSSKVTFDYNQITLPCHRLLGVKSEESIENLTQHQIEQHHKQQI